MKIIIDKQLKVVEAEGLSRLACEESGFSGAGRVLLFGDILGRFDGERYSEPGDVVRQVFENIEDKKKICDVVRFSVGQFIILIEDKNGINIFCPPSSPGFFYAIEDDLFIVSDEFHDIAGCLKDKRLNEMELLGQLAYGSASPFSTLLDKIGRIPGGEWVVIQKGFRIIKQTYLRRSEDQIKARNLSRDGKSYQAFVASMEAVAKAISNTQKNIYVAHSGGIDSTSILLSLLKNDVKVRPITAYTSIPGYKSPATLSPAQIFSGIICRKLGIARERLPVSFTSEDFKDYRDSLYSLITVFDHPLMHYHKGLADYLKKAGERDAYILLGTGVDACYMLGFKQPLSGTYHFPQNVGEFIKDFIRYGHPFISWYQDALAGRYGKLGRTLVNSIRKKNGAIMRIEPQLEYIASFAIAKWHPKRIPVLTKPLLSISATDEYLEYKIDTVLRPIIGNGMLEGIKRGEISGAHLNHLSKLVKYYTCIMAALYESVALKSISGYQYLFPAAEGPLLDYFLTLRLSWRDVLNYKRYLYDYFRRETGTSHKSLINRNVVREAKKEIKNTALKSSGYTNAPVKTEFDFLYGEFLDKDILSRVRKEKQLLLDLLTKGPARDYVIGLYNKIESGSASRYRTMALYNSILHLKNILKA